MGAGAIAGFKSISSGRDMLKLILGVASGCAYVVFSDVAFVVFLAGIGKGLSHALRLDNSCDGDALAQIFALAAGGGGDALILIFVLSAG